MLKIKITEEFNARKETDKSSVQSAMLAGRSKSGSNKNKKHRCEKSDKHSSTKDDSKIKCYKCGVI